jgi:hypothetical protein
LNTLKVTAQKKLEVWAKDWEKNITECSFTTGFKWQ